MQFTPQSETEIRSEMMLPDGEYDFEVEEAVETVSKSSNNEMIALTLRCFRDDGSSALVNDWLVASEKPMCKLKVRTFCESTGILDTYEQGMLSGAVCQALAGRVVIGHKDDPQYGPKNAVIDYCKPRRPVSGPTPPLGVPTQQTQRANAVAAAKGDAEIPF